MITALLALSLVAQTDRPDPRAALLTAINTARAQRALPPVNRNESLERAAQAMADDLSLLSTLSHEDSRGRKLSERAVAAGYRDFKRVAENLAAGSDDPDVILDLWEKSPGHQRNLYLAGVKDAGIGLASRRGSRYGTYWVLIVGELHPARR